MVKERILAINPGSTSTKIAVYDGEECLFTKNIEHTTESLSPFKEIYDQYHMRKDEVLKALELEKIDIKSLNAVVARGGLLPPVSAGAYKINEDMIYQLKYKPVNEHASNLAAPIAYEIAQEAGVESYVYDPVTVDEMLPIARISGLPEIQRMSMGHNLNMRAAAMKYAKGSGKKYSDLTLIVAHLGGGITLTLHDKGRIIDMVSDEEGPFSPERTGGLPIFQLIKMATSGEYDYKSLMKKVRTQGGLKAYCGTIDAKEIEKRIADGDEKAKLVYEAMAEQVAKDIGKLSVVVCGKVDAIILTGGIAYSEMLTGWIIKRTSFISKVSVIAGENEMLSLTLGTLRILRGEEKPHIFKKTI